MVYGRVVEVHARATPISRTYQPGQAGEMCVGRLPIPRAPCQVNLLHVAIAETYTSEDSAMPY